jgi:hypothetical protein
LHGHRVAKHGDGSEKRVSVYGFNTCLVERFEIPNVRLIPPHVGPIAPRGVPR